MSQRPTAAEIAAAAGKYVPDVIGPNLRVLFCGINPGLYSGAVGHHFARPGNRFWPALQAGGFTGRVLSPFEDGDLLSYALGITNFVERATATAAELAPSELVAGGQRLREKALRYRPAFVAVLGITAFRAAYGDRAAGLGPQPEPLGSARVWVLPNPSGLNAHYSMQELGRLFGELRREVGAHHTSSGA